MIKKKMFYSVMIGAFVAGLLTGCGGDTGSTQVSTVNDADTVTEEKEETDRNGMDFNADYSSIETGKINAGVSVHDPSVYKDNGVYYIFGTHMTAAKTGDLRTWDRIADGYRPSNKIYGGLYDEDKDAFLAAYEDAKNVEGKVVKYFYWLGMPKELEGVDFEWFRYDFKCAGENVEVTVNGHPMEVVHVDGVDYYAKITEFGAIAILCD